MPAALEAIAAAELLVQIIFFALLVGFLVALRHVVAVMLNPVRGVRIDVSFIHVPIGRWITDPVFSALDAAEDWCRHWLHESVHYLAVLFDGMVWSAKEAFDLLTDGFDATATFTHDLVHNHIPAVRHDIEEWARIRLREARAAIMADVASIYAPLHALRDLAEQVPVLIRAAVREFHETVVQPIEHRLTATERAIAERIMPRLGSLEDWANGVRAELSSAVGTIEDILPRLPHLGMDDLEDIINRVPWRRLAGLLSLGFLTHALLKALTREAGLDSSECRGKVKRICNTDTGAWEQLMAGLLTGFALPSFSEFVDAARELEDRARADILHYADPRNH